ncbi:cyclin-domain-containing protein [Bimuria novae-zelandiae CBS 107.79]|uniref:Cyclin-domain-containing protein n=1 Tax=Bimuria novae-zelandiae CBS 107.79 TaxID=1447943 RepID=A0A6A5VIB1_9PLEO|nr:cyclin-domain-containing protein [Bimuria novae-zelandiae CBS 107.79]
MNPPSAPNPAGDAGVLPEFASLSIQDAPSPPEEEELDVMNMTRETAMKILVRSILALANAAGEIPATPALSRPSTPQGKENVPGIHVHRRTASRPATPIPAERARTSKTELEQPEAHHDEPTITSDIGAGAEPIYVQRANMARKFFSKSVPKVSLEDYVNRIQQYCPLSTAVWLAAGSYVLRLSLTEKYVPLTHRTMHRLVLACLTTAMKTLEDHRWPQKRLAAVGGVDEIALSRLEICVEFLLDFDLQFLSEGRLTESTIALQKAGQAVVMNAKLPASFNLRMPKLR